MIVQVDPIVCEVVDAEEVDESDELGAVAGRDGCGDRRVVGRFSVRAAAGSPDSWTGAGPSTSRWWLVACWRSSSRFAANSGGGTRFHGAASFAPKQYTVQSAGRVEPGSVSAERVSSPPTARVSTS